MVLPAGFEPATIRFWVERICQLRYGSTKCRFLYHANSIKPRNLQSWYGVGTQRGTRTPGPLLRRQLLYPPELFGHTMELITGVEPATPGLQIRCSASWAIPACKMCAGVWNGRTVPIATDEVKWLIRRSFRRWSCNAFTEIVEQITGFEPAHPTWKDGVLPLHHICIFDPQ